MNQAFKRGSVAILLAAGLTACSQSSLQTQLDAAEAQNRDLQSQLASAVSTSSTPAMSDATSGQSHGPDNAKPGECYARVTVAAQFRTIEERVIDRPAGENLRVIPATYGTETEKVVVREASERLEIVPATYKTVSEQVLVEAETTRLETIPAKYETVSRTIKVRDAYTAWKPGGKIYAVGENALGGTVVENRTTNTGDVMCLVEIPAEYKTVTEKKLVTPAATRKIVTPAKYTTVTRTVVNTPAATRTVVIPAEYKTITKRVVTSEARTEAVAIPETYRTITRQEEAAPAQTTWASVLCDYNATPDVVRKLQQALKAEGHYSGPIDGVIGSQTRGGIQSYQARSGVRSDILTMGSARKLGLTL
jgi:hypothetical protein